VGWLIHDGKDVKALAPNMADIGDEEEDMQALGIIHIPAPAVKRIVALTEVTSSSCADAVSCCAPELTAEAATLFALFEDLGSRSTFAAFEATLAEVNSCFAIAETPSSNTAISFSRE
jgi:hypothetical protein